MLLLLKKASILGLRTSLCPFNIEMELEEVEFRSGTKGLQKSSQMSEAYGGTDVQIAAATCS